MKKNIGNALALYPTPLVVVGAIVDNKPNYVLVGHLGIIGHNRIMISLSNAHYTNKGIKETRSLSVNIVDKGMLPKADYVGCVSGKHIDKSAVFKYSLGKTGTPIIEESPVSMDCIVEDIYVTDGFESFICKISDVYADEKYLDKNGKIDYEELKPILFEMPTYKYLESGDVIGDCMKLNNKGDENE